MPLRVSDVRRRAQPRVQRGGLRHFVRPPLQVKWHHLRRAQQRQPNHGVRPALPHVREGGVGQLRVSGHDLLPGSRAPGGEPRGIHAEGGEVELADGLADSLGHVGGLQQVFKGGPREILGRGAPSTSFRDVPQPLHSQLIRLHDVAEEDTVVHGVSRRVGNNRGGPGASRNSRDVPGILDQVKLLESLHLSKRRHHGPRTTPRKTHRRGRPAGDLGQIQLGPVGLLVGVPSPGLGLQPRGGRGQ
mmetsp:Transcript_22682/g.49686  ORF Transcript_22682/g.49686 Transcript_22682/m.49686 type:complete len:245 (+) Transcript_22682:998-1732(+)